MAEQATARETVLAFRVNSSEAQSIHKAAAREKLATSDFLRARALLVTVKAEDLPPVKTKATSRVSCASTSPRLLRILELLRQAGPEGMTSAEIVKSVGGLAISTCISEIRRGGHSISCKFEGLTSTGARTYRYVLS